MMVTMKIISVIPKRFNNQTLNIEVKTEHLNVK